MGNSCKRADKNIEDPIKNFVHQIPSSQAEEQGTSKKAES